MPHITIAEPLGVADQKIPALGLGQDRARKTSRACHHGASIPNAMARCAACTRLPIRMRCRKAISLFWMRPEDRG